MEALRAATSARLKVGESEPLTVVGRDALALTMELSMVGELGIGQDSD